MATSFHDKFKQKTGIILNEINENNFESSKKPKKNENDFKDWKKRKALRYFFDFETLTDDKRKNPDFNKRCNKC